MGKRTNRPGIWNMSRVYEETRFRFYLWVPDWLTFVVNNGVGRYQRFPIHLLLLFLLNNRVSALRIPLGPQRPYLFSKRKRLATQEYVSKHDNLSACYPNFSRLFRGRRQGPQATGIRRPRGTRARGVRVDRRVDVEQNM